MVETTLTVKHKLGLHARPATVFVKTAAGFQAKITVTNMTRQSKTVDAKSIVGILTIGVAQNHEIKLNADGPDEQEAVEALTGLIEDNFGES